MRVTTSESLAGLIQDHESQCTGAVLEVSQKHKDATLWPAIEHRSFL